jgi:hypothetical protein
VAVVLALPVVAEFPLPVVAELARPVVVELPLPSPLLFPELATCAEPEAPNAASPMAPVATRTASPANRRYDPLVSRRLPGTLWAARSALSERSSLPFILLSLHPLSVMNPWRPSGCAQFYKADGFAKVSLVETGSTTRRVSLVQAPPAMPSAHAGVIGDARVLSQAT